jgi:hypothetical protein
MIDMHIRTRSVPDHNSLGWRCVRCLRSIGKVLALICLLTISERLPGQSNRPSEYQVKAAYIYNFGKFVKWPPSSPANQGNSFTICVFDADPFGPVLQSTLAGKTITGKPVLIQRIAKPQEANNCHILFLNSVEESRLKLDLTALAQASVLTVSDINDFSKRGGMIQFILEGDRVRFEINRTNAEGAGLVLASDLLKVAATVRGNGQAGDH